MPFSSNIPLVVALITVGSFTLSSAQFNDVTLLGVVFCPNASLSDVGTYRVIPHAKVDVVCPVFSFPRVTKSTTTNLAGVYSFPFSPSDILFGNPESCYLNITLPANSCEFDPPGGAIRYPILAVRSLFGRVLTYSPGVPSYDAA